MSSGEISPNEDPDEDFRRFMADFDPEELSNIGAKEVVTKFMRCRFEKNGFDVNQLPDITAEFAWFPPVLPRAVSIFNNYANHLEENNYAFKIIMKDIVDHFDVKNKPSDEIVEDLEKAMDAVLDGMYFNWGRIFTVLYLTAELGIASLKVNRPFAAETIRDVSVNYILLKIEDPTFRNGWMGWGAVPNQEALAWMLPGNDDLDRVRGIIKELRKNRREA